MGNIPPHLICELLYNSTIQQDFLLQEKQTTHKKQTLQTVQSIIILYSKYCTISVIAEWYSGHINGTPLITFDYCMCSLQ